MFTKNRILKYLQEKNGDALSAFDELLKQAVDGAMETKLGEIGLSSVSIHVDFSMDYRCIDVQSRYCRYYVEMQIEPEVFTVAYDLDEADDYTSYPLLRPEGFYDAIKQVVRAIEQEQATASDRKT